MNDLTSDSDGDGADDDDATTTLLIDDKDNMVAIY